MWQLNSIRNDFLIATGLLLALVSTACATDIGEVAAVSSGEISASADGNDSSFASDNLIDRPAGWSGDSHGNDAEPNYDVVFPDDQVNQITITIAPDDWQAMQDNMTELFGESGTGDGMGLPGNGLDRPQGRFPQPGEDGPGEGFEPPEGRFPRRDGEGFPEGVEPSADAERPPMLDGFEPNNRAGGGQPGRGDMTPENPEWVPATVEFEGKTWTHVGVRYKGNSSLTSGWRSGESKLPLKLDFDEFEDEYPEIDDQRFYGFKQLSLANGFSDASFLRDAATSDILQEAGLPAAETSFYEVVLDYGEGPVTLGLYTVIEVVDDTVVDRYFGSDDGNIYEGEGLAASFAAGTFEQIEDSFQKENNEDEADWRDIEALFDVLHSDERTGDPAAWRANIEAIFNVDAFLKWLAISAVIEHWDAYGNMNHNYYLYNDPETGQLTWISWDHNMAMSTGMGGRGPGDRAVSLDKANINDDWPLIRFLLDDPVYYERYLDYLAETITDPFEPDHMAQVYQEMADLIAPYAAADVGHESFDAAVQQLIDHAYQRANVVEEFLTSEGA